MNIPYYLNYSIRFLTLLTPFKRSNLSPGRSIRLILRSI